MDEDFQEYIDLDGDPLKENDKVQVLQSTPVAKVSD